MAAKKTKRELEQEVEELRAEIDRLTLDLAEAAEVTGVQVDLPDRGMVGHVLANGGMEIAMHLGDGNGGVHRVSRVISGSDLRDAVIPPELVYDHFRRMLVDLGIK